MKEYLIAGASSGVGKALATILNKRGHRVYGTYRTTQPKESEGLSYHYLDVTKDAIDLDFLPNKLDGLVYCPGVINLKPFTRVKATDFMEDFSVQVLGAVRLIQAALPGLKRSGNSSIVLFSTVAVKTGFPYHTLVSTSKGAVEGLTRSLAAELVPKIRVNCIAPSITDTPLATGLLNTDAKRKANAGRHPLKRIGYAEDIAEMAAFLLSDQSGWITGQVYGVDGGISSIKGL